MSMAGWYLRRFFGLKADLPSSTARRQPGQPVWRMVIEPIPPKDGYELREGPEGPGAEAHERFGYSRRFSPSDRARLDAYWPD
jgi:hypothetical protein